MTFEPALYLWGGSAALLVGLSKTGLPGAAIPAVALMAEAFPGNSKHSVGALLPILLVGDVIAVGYYRRHAQWNRLLALFPYVLLGMIPAVLVLRYVDDRHFRPVLGWLVLALLTLSICQRRFGWTEMPGRWWFVLITGVLAGFGTMVANAAGPVMSAYLISRGLFKEQFVGTAAWFFFIVNLGKLPVFQQLDMLTLDTLRFDVWLAPAVVVGALLGIRVLARIPQGLFDYLVLALAGVAAVRLIIT